MEKNKIWIHLGICSFSIVMGILIGVSQSPILGVFISGILGLLVGVSGSIFRKDEPEKQRKETIYDFNIIGKVLLQFSIFLIIGVYIGSEYRANIYEIKSPEFIWTEQNKPNSVNEAIDWILVNQILSEKGYAKNQIRELYELGISERNRFERDLYYDYKEQPYFKMLIETYEESLSINTNPNQVAIPRL